MNADERKMMRKVMAKVHPDLFVANPYESQCNSDSLKVRSWPHALASLEDSLH